MGRTAGPRVSAIIERYQSLVLRRRELLQTRRVPGSLPGRGRRRGPDGLLKYTEQTVAAALVVSLDAPQGMSPQRWQAMRVPMAEFVAKLLGR